MVQTIQHRGSPSTPGWPPLHVNPFCLSELLKASIQLEGFRPDLEYACFKVLCKMEALLNVIPILQLSGKLGCCID